MTTRPTGTKPKKKTGKNNKKSSSAPVPGTVAQPNTSELGALNPYFDPRMRRIGNPLNRTAEIRRGFIVKEQDKSSLAIPDRVNFLFNPSQLDTTHSVDAENTKNPNQARDTADVTSPYYTSTSSGTGVSLLYDRTYEMFSSPKTDNTFAQFAAKFGVYADVAAWYTYLGMIPAMPEQWSDSLLTQPMFLFPSYLYVGPRMPFYGYVTTMNVTYSHWSLNMVPQRCKVDIGFSILPKVDETTGSTATSPLGNLLDNIGDIANNLFNLGSGSGSGAEGDISDLFNGGSFG